MYVRWRSHAHGVVAVRQLHGTPGALGSFSELCTITSMDCFSYSDLIVEHEQDWPFFFPARVFVAFVDLLT